MPTYIVPAYLERLPAIPMAPGDKADRERPPAPTRRAIRGTADHTAPATGPERAPAETRGGDRVLTSSHFYVDLGTNPLLLDRSCARLPPDTTLPPVPVDAYLHPMITGLTAVLDGQPSSPSEGRPPGPAIRASTTHHVLAAPRAGHCPRRAVRHGRGAGGRRLVGRGSDRPVEACVRSIVQGVAMIIGYPALLILLERELADRWNPFPVAIRANLMALFMRSPSHVQCPRALGASVGKGVTVLDVQ